VVVVPVTELEPFKSIKRAIMDMVHGHEVCTDVEVIQYTLFFDKRIPATTYIESSYKT
jgi:hypothetical protein